MKFSIIRDQLLKPLQFVNGVVEKRHTLPVLGNILLKVLDSHRLEFVGTDLEVELTAFSDAASVQSVGAVTVPARKLFDICRSCPENSEITLQLDGQKLLITFGSSRFSLATLPAIDFPETKEPDSSSSFQVDIEQLRKLLERTSFAIAQQDVRYYLNGSFWNIENGQLTAVATDGHRLALCSIPVELMMGESARRAIVPRKAIYEISRLLADRTGAVTLHLSPTNVKLSASDVIMASKLIDGRYPDYHNAIPRNNPYQLIVDRDILKSALTRVAILSNEKYRGVRLILSENQLMVSANNPEQEEAEDTMPVLFPDQAVDLALNVGYLLEMINSFPTGNLIFSIYSAEKSLLVELENDTFNALNVLMPLRL